MNSWTAGVSFGATYYQGGSLGHAGRVTRKNLSSFGKVGQKSQQIRPINEFLSNSIQLIIKRIDWSSFYAAPRKRGIFRGGSVGGSGRGEEEEKREKKRKGWKRGGRR